jgi:uncharacterized membrane protein
MIYLLTKYLHILSAVFLFGFGMGSYLYFIAACRTQNTAVISGVARMVVWFDARITTTAGFLQIFTGYGLARMSGQTLGSGWLLYSMCIFLLVGALWLPVLILQKQLKDLADHAAVVGLPLNDRFASLYRWWFWMGIIAFSGMFAIVFLMATKMTPIDIYGLFIQMAETF